MRAVRSAQQAIAAKEDELGAEPVCELLDVLSEVRERLS
jgi:hypothetical protein